MVPFKLLSICAEMAAELEPCHSMVWHAAHCLDNVPEESRLMACHTKAHVSEVGKQISKTATEVHGGMGFTDELDSIIGLKELVLIDNCLALLN